MFSFHLSVIVIVTTLAILSLSSALIIITNITALIIMPSNTGVAHLSLVQVFEENVDTFSQNYQPSAQ